MVTIQCLVFNHEPYIRKCLEGFVMQKTNFRYEAIVHDDVSTDGSVNVIKEFEEKYPGIIKPIYETENQFSKNDGSLNRVIEEHTRGKYIALCEGDDYWTDPNKLQKQVDYMESHPECSLVFHNAFIEKASIGKIVSSHRICSHPGEISLRKIIRDGGLIPTLSIMYRAAAFKEFNNFPFNCPVGDLRIQTYAAMVGKVHYMNEIMGVYRLVDTSVTHVIADNVNKYINHHEKFIEWYKSVDEYTNYKYKREIKGAIHFSEARIHIAQKEYCKLWNPKFYSYIWNEPINMRMGLLLRMIGLEKLYKIGHSYLEKRRSKK